MPQAANSNTMHFAYPHAGSPVDALLQAANALSFFAASVECEDVLSSRESRAGLAMLLTATAHTIRQASERLP